MAKKSYDESKVLAQLRFEWEADIDYQHRVVRTPLGAPLSIHICGKIDFLTNYCGWRWSTYVKKKKVQDEKKQSKKPFKKKKNNEYSDD